MAKSAPDTIELTIRDTFKEDLPDENRQYLNISTSFRPHAQNKNVEHNLISNYHPVYPEHCVRASSTYQATNEEVTEEFETAKKSLITKRIIKEDRQDTTKRCLNDLTSTQQHDPITDVEKTFENNLSPEIKCHEARSDEKSIKNTLRSRQYQSASERGTVENNVTLLSKHVKIPSDDKIDEVPLASGSKNRTTGSKDNQSISDVKDVLQCSPPRSTLPQILHYDRSVEKRGGNYADSFQALLHRHKLKNEGPEKNLLDKTILDHFIEVQEFPADIGPSCYAYIINNENFDVLQRRRGSDIDQKALEEALQAILFKTSVDKDLKAEEMLKKILAFIEKFKEKKPRVVFIAILTHGGEGDILFGTDGKRNTDGSPKDKTFIKRSDVEEILLRLHGTSKILLIQACRGEKEYQPNYHGDSPSENIEVKSGMFVVNMTYFGCVAYRSTKRGSFCLQELAKGMKEKAHFDDFQTIFDSVDRDIQVDEPPNVKFTRPQMSTRDDAQLYLIDRTPRPKSSSSGSKDIREKNPGI